MTREEALIKVKGCLTDYFSSEDYDEVEDIMTALEQQPNEDCISREALDNAISDLTYWHFENDRLIPGGGGNKTETVFKVDDVTRLTHILPPATPQQKTGQQKTGHWIEHNGALGIPHIECSECGIWFLKADLPRKSYCPNCGSCNGDMIKNIMKDITNNKRRCKMNEQESKTITIPKNATKGEVLKLVFPKVETRDRGGDFISFTLDGIVGSTVERKWWDSPYNAESGAN